MSSALAHAEDQRASPLKCERKGKKQFISVIFSFAPQDAKEAYFPPNKGRRRAFCHLCTLQNKWLWQE